MQSEVTLQLQQEGSSPYINLQQAVLQLFNILSEREQDVLKKRFRLYPEAVHRLTLEDIGRSYNITRERVRQIEAESIRKLKQLERINTLKQPILAVEEAMLSFLKRHGGVTQEDYLIDSLIHGFWDPSAPQEEALLRQQRDALSFIVLQLLEDRFDRVQDASDKYYPVWALENAPFQSVRDIIDNFIEVIETESRPLLKTELIGRVKERESYKNLEQRLMEHLEKMEYASYALDELIFSYLKISRIIKQNLFQEWGLAHWSTITPKKINDKIYLILKRAGRPLHFMEITAAINEACFDHKEACAATVHNELILDEKYILVGRGMYALKEWGYQHGTVPEIISRILHEKGPLQKQDIVTEVQKQRMIKEATVNLALMNRNLFTRLPRGEYALTEQRQG